MFVKYDCRCTAFRLSDEHIWVVQDCRREYTDNKYSFVKAHDGMLADFRQKNYEPLPVEEVTQIFHEVGNLTSKGEDLKSLAVIIERVINQG